MKHGQTIAIARSVLADGRIADATRMIEPLINANGHSPDAPGDVLLRCLMARILLLRSGDVEGVLRLLGAFDDSTIRQRLEPRVQAEVALWLGWSRVWQDDEFYDDARALNLLDEASRAFRGDMNVSGRCWTLIGQAQAYFTIDEYRLMLQALDEASALQEKLNDVQAAALIAHLSVLGARFSGQHREAQRILVEMRSCAAVQNDKVSIGRADAHEAVIAYELGQSPEQIIDSARRAEEVLIQTSRRSGYALMSAYNAHIGALVRQGAWDEADRLVDEALQRTGHLKSAKAYTLLHRARIHMYRGEFGSAKSVLETILAAVHHQHRLLHANVARLYSELMLRGNQAEEAGEWATRSYRNARQAGHVGYQMKALLQLADVSVHVGRVDDARRYLREMEPYGHYFSQLPLAAEQFVLQARFSVLCNRTSEARAFLTQALSAWSMIGNTFGVATAQYELARLLRTSAPAECKTFAEASIQSFERLGARKQVRRLRDLIRALPGGGGDAQQLSVADIAAVLSRSALSVDLVAETWLRLAEYIAPNRWMGVYRFEEKDGWRAVRTHGERENAIRFPDPGTDRLCEEGVDWIRLKHVPSSVYFFAMECGGEDDPACKVIEDRLSAWIPVVGLAFDHALLRGSRTAGGNKSDIADSAHPFTLDGLIYASDAMQCVVEKIERVRSSQSPVLITGESGVGKSLVAACIHRTSDRADKPFVVVDCANFERERIEQQLFGSPRASNGEHSPASGTSRSTIRTPGAVREADGGTLFLDEIEKLPIELQPRLLAFLENGIVHSSDSSVMEKVNVRIIGATSQDIHELIRSGSFREDLYYRLNVVPVRVPPLRERRDEIPLLIHHFLGALSTTQSQRASLSGRAFEAMIGYDWPGNVRQLRNEIERALVFTENEPAPLIDLEDLSGAISKPIVRKPLASELPDLLSTPPLTSGLDNILAGAEKAVIERALAHHDGHVSTTAELLGLTRQGLYKKMKRLGIDASRFQQDPDAQTVLQDSTTGSTTALP